MAASTTPGEAFTIDAEDLVPTAADNLPSGLPKPQAFHESNPQVYRALVKLARYVKARGANHWGMRGLFHVLRACAAERHCDVRINQDYAVWYAKEIMRNEPDLNGFFRTRRPGRRSERSA